MRKPVKPDSIAWIVGLAITVRMAATDIYIPSMPKIARYLEVSSSEINLSLTLFLVGSLISLPFLSPLSDIYGRRKIFILGLFIFCVSSISLIFFQHLYVFLFLRIIQGAGATVITTIGYAAIQDIYDTKHSARIFSLISIPASSMPILAPAIGGFLDYYYTWRLCFILIGVLSLILLILSYYFFYESLILKKRKSLSLKDLFSKQWDLYRNKKFILHASLYPFLFLGFWAYLSFSPFYMQEVLHISSKEYGIISAFIALFYPLGACFSARFSQSYPSPKIILIGCGTCVLSSVFYLVISYFSPSSPFIISFLQGIYLMGTAILYGPSVSLTLQCVSQKGLAASVRGQIYLIYSSLGSFLPALFHTGSLRKFSFLLMFISSVATCTFSFLLSKERIREEL